MNQFNVITRGRSTALVAALLVALCLGLIRTTDASAAPAYRDCAALAEGSAQTSASRTNGDATTSFSTANETGQPGTQVIIVEGCAGGIAQSSTAVSSGRSQPLRGDRPAQCSRSRVHVGDLSRHGPGSRSVAFGARQTHPGAQGERHGASHLRGLVVR